MPKPRHLWRHVVINTLASWLHGDERGFRSRGHRIHSSGDYKHRPPADEHRDLHQFHDDRSRDEIRIGEANRAVIGREIVKYLLDYGYRVLAVAVTKVHGHILTELPGALGEVKQIVGHAKRVSSRAVKATMPGTVWSAGGTYKRVLDASHSEKVHDYIIYDQGSDAWTWSFRDGKSEGMFGRKRPVKRKR